MIVCLNDWSDTHTHTHTHTSSVAETTSEVSECVCASFAMGFDVILIMNAAFFGPVCTSERRVTLGRRAERKNTRCRRWDGHKFRQRQRNGPRHGVRVLV